VNLNFFSFKRKARTLLHCVQEDLCDRYYKNPPIEYDDILNAHLHSIYLINIDKGFAKELDPQGYVDLTKNLLGRSEVEF